MSAQGALPDEFGLIETLLWSRDGGYFLRDGHCARLKNSAATLGFVFDQARLDEALTRACAGAQDARLRVRLALARDGAIGLSLAPFATEPPEKIWRTAAANTRFNSGDPLLRHKTTRREPYEKALAASGAEEVIFLNERDEVCEGARTNVFIERDGFLLTPPLSSGLLPGVLRADLLARGKAKEMVLRLEDLRGPFFLGNSLRGLVRASLLQSPASH